VRFCLLTTFFPPEHFGGDAIVVAQLANLLARNGHHVEVVHCVDSFRLLSAGVPTSSFPVDPRVKVHRLEAGWHSPLATYLIGRPFFKPLAQILDRDFDVIHWHNFSLVGGPGALHMGRGVKLCTLHDYWVICPTSVLFRYNREVCTKRTCYRCSLSYGRPPQFWRSTGLMRDALSHLDRILVPSEYTRQRVGVDATVLPHFLAPVGTAPKPARPDYYLFAGRLEKLKGLETVLPFFRTRRLKIAGTGSVEPALRRLASASVEFLGRVAHDSLAPLYAGAIATIVPSLCEETFGLVALESLAQGTPVIVSSMGALPELVERTGGGWVYRDPAELEPLLAALDADPRPAAPRNLEYFSPEHHLARYLKIIEECRRPPATLEP
jgi:glycosyltransferase involved in cell wall biosynthesis